MRKWFQQVSPDRERLLQNRWLRPISHRLTHPEIWHFNRRNVARGVALGLFVGFMLPIGQIVVAALLAATARGNLLVAAAATLVTNPLTFPPIYVAAYRTGSLLLSDPTRKMPETMGQDNYATMTMLDMLTSASLPTLLGLVLFAVTSSALGFWAIHLAWRVSLWRRWRHRSHRGRSRSPGNSDFV